MIYDEIKLDKNGGKRYYKDNVLRKIEFKNGEENYYGAGELHGILHRDNDLPAIINKQLKAWYKNGVRHRENDLPAVEYHSGEKQWHINGNLHRDNDHPAIEQYLNNELQYFAWFLNGRRHRLNKPAIIRLNAYQKFDEEYWMNGQKHREDGPAVINYLGINEYWLKNIFLEKGEHQKIVNHQITIDDINNATNVEKRRLLLEYYGIEKYVLDSKAKITLKDQYGVLYTIPQPDREEQIVVVRVKNSTPELDGSHKEYFLRVPPAMKTPREAIAWTFGLSKKDYKPIIET